MHAIGQVVPEVIRASIGVQDFAPAVQQAMARTAAAAFDGYLGTTGARHSLAV